MASSTHRRNRYDGALIQPPVESTAATAAGAPGGLPTRSLKSFVLEVSAGQPDGVADASDVLVHAADPLPRRRRRSRAMRRTGSALETSAAASQAVQAFPRLDPPDSLQRAPADIAPDVALALQGAASRRPEHVARAQPVFTSVRADAAMPTARRVPPWAASLSLHGALLLALVGMHLPGTAPLDELLWIEPPAVPAELPITDISFQPSPVDAPRADAESPVALIDPGMAAFGELDTTAALAAATGEAAVAAGSMAGELGSFFGESGAGRATFAAGLGDAPTAQFFGAKIEGRRIVFILDNSGSMQDGRLETVIAELLRCVDSLAQDQQFYVIFHSDMVYPLFFPDPVDRYIRPTEANKRRLARWLETVELCLGDSVEEAIAVATMIEPDTVFLLSDGRVQGDKKLRYLLAADTRDFPIHTFAVGMGSSVAGRRNLADVAAANGGEFRESDIPDEMKDLARRKPRPYHNETPGEVWGRNVKPFRFGR